MAASGQIPDPSCRPTTNPVLNPVSITDADTEPPPDGGYGWICVATCFSINCFTWGIVASYGVYLSYYLSNNIFPTATPTDFAFIGGLNFAIAMLSAPVVTILARRFSTQLPMFLGVLFLITGFVGASFAQQIWHLYLTQGILIGLAVGLTYIPSIAILSQWFHKKRSLANGISAAGSGIGGLIFSFGTAAMIEHISLAWSYRILAVVCGSVNFIATWLIRNRNHSVKPPQRGFDTKLLGRYDVFLLLAWSCISMLGYITLLFSLPDFSRSIGLDSSQAANIAAFLNLGTAIGRPFTGIISDRYGRLETAGVLTLFSGLTCFVIWIPARSYAVTIVFAILNGAVLGVFWVTVGPVAVEVAGLAELPSLLSLAWLSVVVPTAFSEVIALKLRRPESSRAYLYPQIFAGLSYVVASGCMYELRRYKRKQR